LGNYSHYLIYAASSLAEQSYPLALLIDDSDASVSSIRFHGQEPRDYSFPYAPCNSMYSNIYLQNWVIYGVNVGKYFSTMEHMGDD